MRVVNLFETPLIIAQIADFVSLNQALKATILAKYRSCPITQRAESSKISESEIFFMLLSDFNRYCTSGRRRCV